jgi:cytochrome c5
VSAAEVASAFTRTLLIAGTACVLAGVVLVAADDLPDGEGRKILEKSCTTCHDLTEVTKLRGFYTRAQWRDVVVTMKEYGATVDDKQVDVLTDYLTANLGKK